jgi:hypothetical protein
MRNVIAKLYWSDVPLQLAAISGWERFSSKTGIYAKSEDDSYELLMGLANDACSFYRQVAGSSALQADQGVALRGADQCGWPRSRHRCGA